MLSVVKRIKLLLAFILLFGVEENYCSDNSVQNDQNPKSQAQAVKGSIPIQAYIGYEIFANIFYWLFDWYQKKRGWYFYKYYYCGGYRTRLYHKIFYLDIYLRFFILRLVCGAISFFVALLYSLDIRDEKVYYGLFLGAFPEIDLNIRLGKKFYLVIGFKDIFAMPLYSELIKILF